MRHDYDRPGGVRVAVGRSRRTNRWTAFCPECKQLVDATTQAGTMDALAAHMNAHHYQPARGNA